MGWQDVRLTDIIVDGTNVNIAIGPETLQISRADIDSYIAGNNSSLLTGHNVGICLAICVAQNELDMNNDSAIVAHLADMFTWKCFDGIGAFADTRLTSVSIDETNVYFSIGPEGFTLARNTLLAYMEGQDALTALAGNVSIRLKGGNINLLDPIAIRSLLSSYTFKYWQ